jgi:hypothetical protein
VPWPKVAGYKPAERAHNWRERLPATALDQEKGGADFSCEISVSTSIRDGSSVGGHGTDLVIRDALHLERRAAAATGAEHFGRECLRLARGVNSAHGCPKVAEKQLKRFTQEDFFRSPAFRRCGCLL